MKSYFNFLKKVKNQAGVSAVIIAIVLTMLIGFTAFAVDVGYMYLTKNELQNVADAAALAGAGHLGSTYEGLSREEQSTYEFTRENIVNDVKEIALENQAAKMHIFINDADVTIGTWTCDGETCTLNPMTGTTLILPDAVRVIARRDGNANGPILTFFARIFNIATVNVVADATAALTGPATIDEGELKTPFALSDNMFPHNCTDLISFSPTRDSCAGWHNFFDAINAASMKKKLLALIIGDGDGVDEAGNSDCLLEPCGKQWLFDNFDHLFDGDPFPEGEDTPETEAGDYFDFQGGAIASLFEGWYLSNPDMDVNIPDDIKVPENTNFEDFDLPAPLLALFDYFRRRDDDGNDAVWTAVIPVYKEEGVDCTNPNTSLEIVGFAEIEVLQINPPPDKTVNVTINCEKYFLPVRGGGATFGLLRGTIPNLVE